MRADVITLVKDEPGAHGVYEPHREQMREVFCEVRSVGMRESYEARSQGLTPSVAFALALAEDYEGEHELIWHGIRHRIIRTYVNGDGIELTCEVKDHDC